MTDLPHVPGKATPTGGAPAPGTDVLGARDVLALAAVTLGVRAAFTWYLPAGVNSSDLLQNWHGVVRALEHGQNPYNTTTLSYLNWPPLWMQTLFGLSRLSHWSGLPFDRTVQGFLIACDVAAVCIAGAVARELQVRRRASIIALAAGFAANPISVLLSCQHCNFDPLVGLLSVAAVLEIVRFAREPNVVFWLRGCAWAGIAILAKTVPFVFVSVLTALGMRVDRRAWPVGALLAFGPVIVGMSIIYSLGPEEVTRNVLTYRSVSGYFGVTGLLTLAGRASLVALYERAFTGALALAMIAAALFLRPHRARSLGDRRVWLLVPAMFLLAIPILGPGYGPQYLAWSIPLLCIVAAAYPGALRIALAAGLLVGAGTYVVEYGLFPSHGALWLHLPGHPPSAEIVRASAEWSTQPGQTHLRLPLFVAMLTVLSLSGWTLSRTPAPAA